MKWNLTLEELVAATEAKVVSQVERNFDGIGTDTRADLSAKVFFALKGDAFDAHDFLEAAQKAKAGALVVHRLPPEPSLSALKAKVTIVQVGDTLKSLQDLGNFWRKKMKARILGITGTNGKTTTKEFTAAILETKFKVQYSKGSFNNHWGVPISLLSIQPDHEIAVIEMGMNHPGELKDLSAIV
jgi:UDP-N-acetylmuramoyl-tripeptide--D-alanyl-D-alanine ligase